MIGNPTPTTAIVTTTDAAVPVLTTSRPRAGRGYIVNKGTVDGFFRLDGGDWCVLPAAGSIEIPQSFSTLDVCRIPSGSNLAGVWFIGFPAFAAGI